MKISKVFKSEICFQFLEQGIRGFWRWTHYNYIINVDKYVQSNTFGVEEEQQSISLGWYKSQHLKLGTQS
jgi:hypothetical protein